MSHALADRKGWAVRWPRVLGAILLAAAAQAGIGAWIAAGSPAAAYLAGSAATAGVVGVLLLTVPLRPAQFHPRDERADPGAAAAPRGL